MRRVNVYLLILALVCAIASTCHAQAGFELEPEDNYQPQVFLTEEQALLKVLPDCDEIVYDEIILTADEKNQLQNRLRRKIYENSLYHIYRH